MISGKRFVGAARSGNIEVLGEYLHQATVEQKAKALLHAVREGHIFVTRILLEEGATSPTGNCLWEAVRKRQHSIVQLLLKYDLDKNYAASNGRTALMEAVMTGDERMVSILLEASVELNKQDFRKRSALGMALRSQHIGIVKQLLEFGASARYLGHFLHWVIHSGNVELVKALLKADADPERKYKKGYPLHNAVAVGNEQMVASLLQAGVNVNNMDKKEHTALFYALSGGFVEISRMLVDYGASTLSCDGFLEKAVKNNNIPVALLLLKAAGKHGTRDIALQQAFSTATRLGFRNMVDALINVGANVNSVYEDGRSPLNYALSRNNRSTKLAELLTSHGAEATSCEPLMRKAIINGNLEHVRLLLKSGANPNAIDGSKRRFAVVFAVQYGRKEIVCELLAAGADVNSVCGKGRSALYYAITNNELEIAEILVSHGAEPVSCELPMKNAIRDGNIKQVRLLLKCGADPNTVDNSNQRLAIVMAVQYNRREILCELLCAGADVNSACELGRSALYYAINGRKLEIAKVLVQHGAEATSCEPLMTRAILDGNIEQIQLLLSCGVDPNYIDIYKRQSTLVTAAQCYRKDVLCELLKAGADVNSQVSGGHTALMWAAYHGDIEMVKILLSSGADVNARLVDQGYTAIMYAAERGHESVIQELLDANANLEIRNWRKETVLDCIKRNLGSFIAIWQQMKWIMDSNRYENVDSSYFPIAARFFSDESEARLKKLDRALIDKNVEWADGLTSLFGSGEVNVNELDDFNRSVLMYMAYKGYTGIVALLLSMGANVDIKDFRGMTALTWATNGRNVDVVQLLISFCANVNVPDNLNRSALHHAVRARDIFIATVLMNAKGKLGSSCQLEGAIIWAATTGHALLVHELCDVGVGINELDDYRATALIWAAYSGHTDCVKELIQRKANINSVDWHGRTALWYALDQGHDEVVNILLPGAGLKDIDNGSPALCVAARRGKIEIMRVMLTRGVDVESAEPDGNTALLCAAQVGCVDAVDMLLKNGADVNSFNSKGESAMHLAAYADVPKILDLLIEKKANIEVKNGEGLTPLLVASRAGNSDAVEAFLKHGAIVTEVDNEGNTALDLAISDVNEITDGAATAAEYLIVWGSEARDLEKTANAVLGYFEKKKEKVQNRKLEIC